MNYKKKKNFLQHSIITNILSNSVFFMFLQIQNFDTNSLRVLQKALIKLNIKKKYCQNNILLKAKKNVFLKTDFINNIYQGQLILLYISNANMTSIEYVLTFKHLLLELKKYMYLIPLGVFFEKRFTNVTMIESLIPGSYFNAQIQLLSVILTNITFIRLLQKIKN